MVQALISSKCASSAGSCTIDFGVYSELSNPVYINQANLASGPYGMGGC